LKQAAFANLASDEVVDAVLECIDLFDASDLGLVEVLCSVRVSIELSRFVALTYVW
jgi:hypothetical protein